MSDNAAAIRNKANTDLKKISVSPRKTEILASKFRKQLFRAMNSSAAGAMSVRSRKTAISLKMFGEGTRKTKIFMVV